MVKKTAPKTKKAVALKKSAVSKPKVSTPSVRKAAKSVKPKAPAAKPAKPKTLVAKSGGVDASSAELKGTVVKLEAEMRAARQNQMDLGRRIDEVGDVGERILDEIDSIRREMDSLRGGPLAAKIGRIEEAAKIMQAEISLASSERKGIVKELKKAVDDIEDYQDHDGRCNAGPAIEKLKEFDEKFAQMHEAIAEARRAAEFAAVGLVAKINELAAKFSMHSHFLKARNFDQDLLFHVDAPSPEAGPSPLSDSPRTLGVKPVRAASEGSENEMELRLTPPRHWEDPLIWFGNVGPVSKE